MLKSNFKIGFLGAGQLARMSALQAFRYGWQVVSYSDREEQEPLENLTPLQYKGGFDDIDMMVEFAKACDVITLENEFIDSRILDSVVKNSGTPLYPSPDTFALIENKLIEKQTFESAGIPVTPYALVKSENDMIAFGKEHDWPYLLKSSKGGYDGYGNETVTDLESAQEAFKNLGGEQGHDIIAEAFVDFRMELAVQVARNTTGLAVYPCCETVQENHICTAVLAPARISPELQQRAQDLAVAAVEAIDGRGIFAFEFFLENDGTILLNESAPRPHNSGHYSIEGCVTSQFENHIRAVSGLPLGSAELRAPAAAMINLLGTHNRPASAEQAQDALATSDGHLHIYGKQQSKVGRKMAHYTLLGNDMEQTLDRALTVTANIEI